MIVGASNTFAIESEIATAFEQPGFLALGQFLIHVSGEVYGVRQRDATMLACSVDAVADRIERQGTHVVPFSAMDAANIAAAVRSAIYSDEQQLSYFGIPLDEFVQLVYATNVIWAPDGDEAFDDGSLVLHFDIADNVRLIAFRSDESNRPRLSSLREVWLSRADFYMTLSQWRQSFLEERARLLKTSSQS